MAENAIKATELGARGIDLNFGCPARLVNKSKGGAALLQHPELIHNVVKRAVTRYLRIFLLPQNPFRLGKP